MFGNLLKMLIFCGKCEVMWDNVLLNGGESGIRTHGTLFTYTRFPSVRLKPLGHLSVKG